jgi:hypothetical protein
MDAEEFYREARRDFPGSLAGTRVPYQGGCARGHNGDFLKELGFSSEDIARLEERGVVSKKV